MAEKWLAGRAARTLPASAAHDDASAVRAARRSAQDRVRRGGALYWSLWSATAVMKLDLWLFGRFRTGPFFALLRKPHAPGTAAGGPGI
jgi:hypothetical protein